MRNWMLDEKKTEEIEDIIISYRRYIHQNPELSYEENKTSLTIQSFLKENGIEFETGFCSNGILAVIKGDKPGAIVALRADMDALPITEKNTFSYASKQQGVMHACGHDAHTAMLMGTALALKEQQSQLAGTVLLVFQPAEEFAPTGGAAQMMEDGIFDRYSPDVIVAQHVWPDLPVGKIGVKSGPQMGNSDRFRITIEGSGGHASMPHQTKDAVIIASEVVSLLQTITSRNVDPLESAVVTVGTISGGDRYNVIASSAVLEGTVRTFKNQVKERVKSRMEDILLGLERAMDARITLEYMNGYPATVNSEQWADHIKKTAVSLFGSDAAPVVQPSLGGEDFGRFLEKYQGVYYWLGTAIPEREVQKPLHDPEFDIDESALAVGLKMMTTTALDTLDSLNQKGGGGSDNTN
ncbi:M20 family metallopeptidase [Alteribacillus sp. HJP-4]|uniref:M20 metallopeptidase family protein n=1 Tax=Alteribacillus sp. HJP-4 TaxID=2775394 RepID=UPI0035CD28BC